MFLALRLRGNNLQDDGTTLLCDVLRESKVSKLQELDLSANGIRPRGAKSVAAYVAVNGSLTKISLAQNKLEEAGTRSICEALKVNKTLKELDMSGDLDLGDNIGGRTASPT